MVNNMAPEMTEHGRVKAKNPNDPKLIDKLSKIVRGNKKIFNARAYRTAITVPQLYRIVQDWHWDYNTAEDEWARKLLDKYDFDGDGRLNAKEFILFSIVHNKRVLGSKRCEHCYYEIIHNRIDPIYSFMDCTSSNKISAEDMWGAFQHLRKSNKYNIYGCLLTNKKYRTSAMNDFVLKNMHLNEGYVSKEEFAKGILLGYWDRQTSPERIFTNDAKTFKSLRWDRKGMIDIVCRRLMGLQMPKHPAPILPEPKKEDESTILKRRFRRTRSITRTSSSSFSHSSSSHSSKSSSSSSSLVKMLTSSLKGFD